MAVLRRSDSDHLLPLLVALLFALAGPNAYAQTQQEDKQPRLLLTGAGPSGTVRALSFSPDSSQLFSGGIDKCVREWQLLRTPPKGQVKATYAREWRWDIARGHRGAVYCMDVSEDGTWLAFSGVCAMDASGDIGLYHLRNERFFVLQGHQNSVGSLSFSPDGERLVSASAQSGDIRVWNLDNFQSRVIRTANRATGDQLRVCFLDDRTVAAAMRFAGGDSRRWRITLTDVLAGQIREKALSQDHWGEVMAISRDPNSDLWATADAAGHVYVWRGTDNPLPMDVRQGRVATSLAFAPGNRLFVSTLRKSLESSRPNDGAMLELWDLPSRQLLQEVVTANGVDNFACAVSNDGKYVATFAGDAGDIWLWPLKDANDQNYPEPFSRERRVRLMGAGQAVWGVAFDAQQSYKLAIARQRKDIGDAPDQSLRPRGNTTDVFDLDNMAPVDQFDNLRWRSPDDGGNGWELHPDDDYSELNFVLRGQTLGTVSLDPVMQGRARCYCWLKDENGSTYGVAIGTDQQDGVYIYHTPLKDGSMPLLRYFRDHTGWVTSLSVSWDGKYLASASVDQTVKIWSLSDIVRRRSDSRRWHALGAAFRRNVADDTLEVTEVHPAGIAARRDLKPGDEIISIRYQGLDKNGNAIVAETQEAEEMLRVIETTPLWNSLRLSVQREGERRGIPLLFKPAWEPLLTLFLNREREWAAWTPQGYYDSSVLGDEFFGWQINQLRREAPRFHRADQFRDELERPDVLKNLLRVGNVPQALDDIDRRVPRDVQNRVWSLGKITPQVEIVEPPHNLDLGVARATEIQAELTAADQKAMEGYQLRCYVNGVPQPQLPNERVGSTLICRWKAEQLDPLNRIVVALEGDETMEKHIFDDIYVHSEARPEPYRLHLVTLSGSKYFPENYELNGNMDADRMIAAVRSGEGAYYRLGQVRSLRDEQVNLSSITRLLGDLRETIKESNEKDFVLIYIAGHGFEVDGEYIFLPATGQEVDPSDDGIKRDGVSWSVLRRFGELPCRKLFVIDTCRQRPGQDFLSPKASKASIRPLRRYEAAVIMAVQSGQTAIQPNVEFDVNGNIIPAGGVFTSALVDAWQGAADGADPSRQNRDGTVFVNEVGHFVKPRVRRMLDMLKTTTAYAISPFPTNQEPFFAETYIGEVPVTRDSNDPQ